MHCFVLSNYQKVQQNITNEEVLLDTSIIVNETNNMNAAAENRNLTTKTGNGNKHKQNREKIRTRKRKNQTKNKKEKSVFIFGNSMVKHFDGWEMSKYCNYKGPKRHHKVL